MSDLIRGLKALREAAEDYDLAEAYYKGRAEEAFAGQLVERYLAGTGAEFKVNFAGRPVDAVMDRLEITAITADSDTTTQVLNDALWTGNQLDLEAPETLKAAVMLGDAYIWVGDGDEDGTVEIFYNDPRTVRIFYDEENPRRKSYAIKSWPESFDGEDAPRVRVNLYYPGRIEKYVSRKGVATEYYVPIQDTDFEVFLDDATNDEGIVEDTYDEVPFFHFRRGRPYGEPAHYNAYGPQDALTKLVINQMSTSEFATFPQRWAIEDGNTASVDSGNGPQLPEDIDEVPDADGVSNYDAGPGTIMMLKNVKSLGQFAAAEADNFLAPMAWYVRAMSASCSTPLHYFDPVGDAPSGQSLRALEAPLIKKVRGYQVAFTATLREALTFALTKVMGIPVGRINIHWANAQVVEDADYWEAVNKKVEAGVPKRQALMEAGYTEQQVDEWGYTTENPNGPQTESAQVTTNSEGEQS